MNISIIYEDNDILVINKPAGLITHPKNHDDKQPSVTQWVVQNYPEIEKVGEDPLRPGLVHRLDKDTSGLLLITKNNPSFLYFKRLFQERKIKKSYLALVRETPKQKHAFIDSPIGRIGMKRTTKPNRQGKLVDKKEALTEYKVIGEYKDFSLLEVIPHTGRTHQIRVHLKSIGHTVAGDPVYSTLRVVPPGLTRLFLHAYRLEFPTPTGKAMVIECDLPADLQSVLDSLDKN